MAAILKVGTIAISQQRVDISPENLACKIVKNLLVVK